MYFFNPDCNYLVTSITSLKEKLLMFKDIVLTSFVVLLLMLIRFLAAMFLFSFSGLCPECSYKLNFHHR